MYPFPSCSIFSQFHGNKKLYVKPHEYDKSNDYKTERIYISSRNKDIIRYVNGFLLRIVKTDRHLSIYRPMISASRMLKIGVCIRRYDKENKTIDPNTFQSYEFEYRNECSRMKNINRYDSVNLHIRWPADFCYATVDIMIMMIDTIDNKSIILREIGEKKNGYAYLEVIGGSIRVYKEILSNQIDYFNKLFDGKKKMRYKLDVDIEDMIEIIYSLSPFDRPIRSGLTYGALYRLSDKFKCLKLANMADNYIYRIKSYAPYLGSYIAFEGYVKEEMALFFEILRKDPEDVKKGVYERFTRETERYEWLAIGRKYDYNYKHRNAEEILREL